MTTSLPDPSSFAALAQQAPAAGKRRLIPMYRRLLSDTLTPVLAYRRLVRPDDRMAPSFLFESVFDGDHVGRYSYVGSRPSLEVVAHRYEITYRDHQDASNNRQFTSDDPLSEMRQVTDAWELAEVPGLPDFTGGWVGYAGYDTVRYLEPEKLNQPPEDDRGLPDMHMQLYQDVVAFDNVQKTILVITHVLADEYDSTDAAYAAGEAKLDELIARLTEAAGDDACLNASHINLSSPPPELPVSNMGEGGYQNAVVQIKEFIKAGDAFQVVPSQRFELQTKVDPFDVYRSLRVVNPSPYMFYLQVDGAILVGSSPEILCRVWPKDGGDGKRVCSRPLAGTRHRGKTPAEDVALEEELLGDPKDRAEHIMLVDLHRNDIGRVATPGTISLPHVLTVERYSHVMHISSLVEGDLAEDKDCWDALRVSLPVGTVSGAPKVRAMQIIDQFESTRRGPYAGAVGCTDFAGNMDMAIALRTMVVMPGEDGQWTVHLQAGGGIVADSDPDAEHQETLNKAAALAKAVAVAERAFG